MSIMTKGVIGMPYTIAMNSEMSRRQFYSHAQVLLAENDRLRTAEGDAMTYKAGMENVAQQRDQLKVELERQSLQFKEWQASHHANYVQVAEERDELKAEVERLKHEHRLLNEHNEFLASSDSRLAPELRAVKDALGLDFTASVIGEVVPAIEALRKLARELRGAAKCYNLHHCKAEQHEFSEPCKVLARIDAVMSK